MITNPLCFMNKIQKFEDLKCWQAARKLVKEVYLMSEEGKLKYDYDTRSQIKRAALSSMNNIAEGFGRYSPKDFIRFLDTSQSSVQEVSSILYVLEDLEYVTEDRLNVARQLADETKALTLGLIRYLRKK
jgi:four helix bundle protein